PLTRRTVHQFSSCSMARPISSNIGVVGAGTMGRGIVQLFAQAGHTVRCHDAQPGAAANAANFVAGMMARAVDKGRMTRAEYEQVCGRIHACADLADLAACEVV